MHILLNSNFNCKNLITNKRVSKEIMFIPLYTPTTHTLSDIHKELENGLDDLIKDLQSMNSLEDVSFYTFWIAQQNGLIENYFKRFLSKVIDDYEISIEHLLRMTAKEFKNSKKFNKLDHHSDADVIASSGAFRWNSTNGIMKSLSKPCTMDMNEIFQKTYFGKNYQDVKILLNARNVLIHSKELGEKLKEKNLRKEYKKVISETKDFLEKISICVEAILEKNEYDLDEKLKSMFDRKIPDDEIIAILEKSVENHISDVKYTLKKAENNVNDSTIYNHEDCFVLSCLLDDLKIMRKNLA